MPKNGLRVCIELAIFTLGKHETLQIFWTNTLLKGWGGGGEDK